jgi:hypothetical protein
MRILTRPENRGGERMSFLSADIIRFSFTLRNKNLYCIGA